MVGSTPELAIALAFLAQLVLLVDLREWAHRSRSFVLSVCRILAEEPVDALRGSAWPVVVRDAGDHVVVA